MIELRGVTIRSGSFSLSDVSFTIPTGAYAVLMGPTGQGKTTILETICGLKTAAAGKIFLDQTDVTDWKPAHRGIGYVPQDLALFPTMTVREHLEFALRLRRTRAADREARIEELAAILEIQSLLGRRIRGLSGGEAQRVALGRALSFRPRLLLLDEPLNALDEATRDRLCELLNSIQRGSGLTTLHVTHSRHEARALADKLLVMEAGTVQQKPLAELDKMPELPEGSECSALHPRRGSCAGAEPGS